MGDGDSEVPAAWVRVTSVLGTGVEQNKAAMEAVTPILEKRLGVPKGNTYVIFYAPPASDVGARGISMHGILK